MVRMNSRRLSALVALPAALALAACSSATSGSGSGSSAPAGSSTASGSASAPSSSTATSGAASTGSATTSSGGAAQLGALLQAGAAKIRTAHLTLAINAAGQSITGSGDEQVVNGKVMSLQITESLPGNQQIRIVHINDKTYAKLPQSLSKSAKPYVLANSNSSNPQLRALSKSIDSSLQSASVNSAAVFVKAASSVRSLGASSVNGVATTRYAVTVDPQKFPSTMLGKGALVAAGIKSIPLDLQVDGEGRPVRIAVSITIAGKTTVSTATISRYNQPVTISAPPANQVSTG